MTNPSGSNVLIVGDAPGAGRIRERLIASGANVSVVSVAQVAARQKRIDTAFIAATLDENMRQLSAELTVLGVTQVFLPRNGEYDRGHVGGATFRRLKASAA